MDWKNKSKKGQSVLHDGDMEKSVETNNEKGKKLKWEEILRRESQCKDWKFIFSRKWGKNDNPSSDFIYLLVKWEEKSQHERAWENKQVANNLYFFLTAFA